MPDEVDVYSDQFQVTVSPYGCTLNFTLTNATPPAPGSVPQSQRQATVRTSLEHLKVMVFVLRRQMLQYEREAGIQVELPISVLNSLGIGHEDWESFWRQ